MCGHRFTTYEFVERQELHVIKRDGRSEPYSREKLIVSFAKACEKRPISQREIERCADAIEQSLWNLGTQEVSSDQIGRLVMDQLRALDGVAYVRYASVYRQFQEVGDFIQEVQTFEQRARPSLGHPELFEKRVD